MLCRGVAVAEAEVPVSSVSKRVVRLGDVFPDSVGNERGSLGNAIVCMAGTDAEPTRRGETSVALPEACRVAGIEAKLKEVRGDVCEGKTVTDRDCGNSPDGFDNVLWLVTGLVSLGDAAVSAVWVVIFMPSDTGSDTVSARTL